MSNFAPIVASEQEFVLAAPDKGNRASNLAIQLRTLRSMSYEATLGKKSGCSHRIEKFLSARCVFSARCSCTRTEKISDARLLPLDPPMGYPKAKETMLWMIGHCEGGSPTSRREPAPAMKRFAQEAIWLC
jgi:hypothetical protein